LCFVLSKSLKKEGGYTEEHFVRGMKECFVPVTMTSLVNATMFGVMNISDVPAVYLTARVALIAVCFLYLAIIFCFSAFCFLDMRRQQAGKKDICFCTPAQQPEGEETEKKCVGTWLSQIFYDGIFKPMIIDVAPTEKLFTHGVLWLVGGLLLGCAIWGISEREVGLGLEDFFPHDHQAYTWASKRTETLSSWSIGESEIVRSVILVCFVLTNVDFTLQECIGVHLTMETLIRS
jgi:Sterol-sensing domain of SREBP cleavage-activation